MQEDTRWNARRVELIVKDIRGQLSEDEERELHGLEARMLERQRRRSNLAAHAEISISTRRMVDRLRARAAIIAATR